MFKDKRTAMVGILVVAVFLSLLILTNPGKALAVSFLKIDDIKGESTDDKHKDQIDVIGWSFGDTQPTAAATSSGGARSAERAKMQDLKITMRTNKASPKLFLGVASGQRFNNAELSVCKSGNRFLKIKLTDVIVSSFVSLGSSGGTDAYPMEEVMLNFGKIEITYTELDSKGTPKGGDIIVNWDVTKSMGK